ncbi:MAG TPA: hypothetical protein VE504_06300 [Nitrososphaeraceae archaeon]|nr:hypothetical protein [Nitrososphaeraceae archaeon]
MARISVVTLPPLDDITWKYEVEVTESDGSGSQTTHQVTMDKGYYMDLTERGRTIPEEFVRKSFEFILDRESKDSILRQFDISQINDFFPEYEKEIKKVLDRS